MVALIVVENVLEMASKARGNDPISIHAMNFSRPIVLLEGILGQARGDPWEGWFH